MHPGRGRGCSRPGTGAEMNLEGGVLVDGGLAPSDQPLQGGQTLPVSWTPGICLLPGGVLTHPEHWYLFLTKVALIKK